MKTSQLVYRRDTGWEPLASMPSANPPQLILVFGNRELLETTDPLRRVRLLFPDAQIIGCSTAGEICGTQVLEDSLVATCVHLERSRIRTAEASIEQTSQSDQAGRQLARSLLADDLAHVFVLSDGLHVNGSELVKGLAETLPPGVAITGGLSADGSKFQRTLVAHNEIAREKCIVAVGFYGKHLHVGCGSLGGWDAFGPERQVTRSRGNVLFELDGEPALALYKRYLGQQAAGLPAIGLRFPLSVRAMQSDRPVVRTILAINETEQSLTFAGDVPQGHFAQLMRANFDRLVDGATAAANASKSALGDHSAALAILISCVGRRLILQQRTEEEVEGVRHVLGASTTMAGFYSYGEISPFAPTARCELHNQTMTVTLLCEAD